MIHAAAVGIFAAFKPLQMPPLLRDLTGNADSLQAAAIQIAIAFTLAAMLAAVLFVVRSFAQRSLQRRYLPSESVNAVLLRLVRRTMGLFLIVLSTWLATRFVPAPPSLQEGIRLVFTIVLAIQGAFWVREILIMILEHQTALRQPDESALPSALSVLTWIINVTVWSLALLLVLDNLGVDVTALIAGLGIGGIAIGFAAQGIVADLFSALSILFDRPFVKGDFLVFGENAGEIEKIGMKTTRIRALSGEQIVISNANLLNNVIHNYRRMAERRVLFTVGVLYETPRALVERIPQMLREAVNASKEDVRFDRAHLARFGDSSLDFEVVYFVLDRDYNRYMDTHQAILLRILTRFEELNIGIAYPTRTVHMLVRDSELSETGDRRTPAQDTDGKKPRERSIHQ